MARFRRRRRGYRRFLRRKPRAYIKRGRVMKAAYRTTRLNKGADTIVTRTSSEAHSSFYWHSDAIIAAKVKFGSSVVMTYSPYEAQSGIFSGLDPRTGWIGLSDRFQKLCALYDAFKINYIKFDIALCTPASFNPATYVSRSSNLGFYDRQLVLGVLVDRCHAYGSSSLSQSSYAEFWTDPATIQTNCKSDQFPRIVVTVKPRRGEYSPWFDTPDSFSSARYLSEYHNKSIVTGFLPAFYFAARITGEPEEVRDFLIQWFTDTTSNYFNLPLKLKVTYGVTFRGSLSNASIAAAKVAEVVNPTEHMEEFDLKADTTVRVEPVDA